MVADEALPLPLVGKNEVVTILDGRISIMSPFFGLGREDHARDKRPLAHFASPQVTVSHQPDEESAQQRDR